MLPVFQTAISTYTLTLHPELRIPHTQTQKKEYRRRNSTLRIPMQKRIPNSTYRR